jgi:hypothetical protein
VIDPEIQIVGDRVNVRAGGDTLVTLRVADFLPRLARALEQPPSCGILPDGVRVWHERGDAVALAVEVPPQVRSVRWLAEGSAAHFGHGARYGQHWIAFPYIELLLVFRGGALTGFQQLYYRLEPLETGEDLLLPNLLNVAKGYGQRCWLCLANMRDVSRLAWPEKIRAVVDHVFSAAFNRSAEEHEGNSYWSAMRKIDPRVASIEAWEAATRQNPRFPLEVGWKAARTTVSAELAAMLDQVIAPAALETATDLAGLMSRGGRPRGRP